MMKAIVTARKKEMGLFRAPKIFDVPKSTLMDKVKSTENKKKH
jgi:hypothetical protein